MHLLSTTALLTLSLALFSSGAAAHQESDSKAEQDTPRIYDADADARAQVDAALKQATRENRRVLIQWGANWCGWCHKLSATFKNDRAVARLLRYDYDLVHVDVGRFDKNVELAEKYGAQWKKEGIPYLTILAADGTVLVNQETGSLEAGPNHDPAKLLAFLEKYKAQPRNAKAVLDAALTKAGIENKQVFLHFGAPWCGWCHRFEAWLTEKDVEKIFNAHFIDVKIDTDRDDGGQALMMQYTKGASRGIPWFVVLDSDGCVEVTSDGPNGNVGCPWTDEEIKVFGTILSKSMSGLDQSQIQQLEQLLIAFRTRSEKK